MTYQTNFSYSHIPYQILQVIYTRPRSVVVCYGYVATAFSLSFRHIDAEDIFHGTYCTSSRTKTPLALISTLNPVIRFHVVLKPWTVLKLSCVVHQTTLKPKITRGRNIARSVDKTSYLLFDYIFLGKVCSPSICKFINVFLGRCVGILNLAGSCCVDGAFISSGCPRKWCPISFIRGPWRLPIAENMMYLGLLCLTYT